MSASQACGSVQQKLRMVLKACAWMGVVGSTALSFTAHSMMTSPTKWEVSPTGAFTYEIPFRLPPGVSAVQPKLSLNYNSQSGNGLAGMGWSLSGLSVITRCPRTMATDGVRGAVSMDSNDRLCMDGQRLMLQSGTYGAEGATYATEIYSGARIVGTALTGTNNTRTFKVYTKAGELMEYTPFNTPANNAALQFVLSRVTDAKGNYWQVHYQTNIAQGEIYPKAICYTGNSRLNQAPTNCVEFGYGSETARYGTPVQRTDKSLAYMAGFAMRSNQRLSGVRTLINATATASGSTWTVSGTQVNEYRLNYKSSSITSRALLSSVTECAGSTNCLPAVSLGWADTLEAPGWYAMPGYEPPYHHFADGIGKFLVQYFDLNGDGLTDIAYHRVAVGVEQKSAYINTGSGWLENKNFTPPFHITADQIGDLSARFIDFNSDGLVDMVYNRHFSNSVQSGAYQNTGEGWIAKPEFTPLFHITADGTGDLSARFLDVNGDGRVDEVYHRHHSAGIQAGAYLNTGNGWQQNLAFTPPFHITADGTGDLSVRFIDFNSDGLADIVFHRVHAGGRQSGAYQNTGVGWQERFEYTPPFHITADSVGDLGVRFIDLNGDGLVDMAYNRFFSGQVQSGAYLNTGKGWIENLAFTPPYHIVADGLGDLATRFIDVNSDGLLDFVFHRQSGPTVFKGAYLNTGSGWIKNTSFDPPYHMFVDGVGDVDVQLFDIDGNSSPEILYHRVFSGGVQKGAFRTSRSRDLLISSDTRGFPGTPEMKAAYGFSSKMNARFREFQRPLTAYPRVNFSPSVPVIEKVEVLNGVGLFNGIRYKYGAALLDLIVGGRGFLGFEWMESQMTGSDGVLMPALRTTYSQQWPCLGMAVQSQVKLPSGGLREQSDSIIRVRTPANATAQTCGTAALNGQITIPYLADSTTRQWEMTSTAQQGVELPRKRTLTTMDGYGNATQVQEQTLNADGTASGYSRTTTNTYDSNAERARQGRLIRSTVTHVKP